MKNIAFSIWMIGYPITETLSRYVQYLKKTTYSDIVEAIVAFISISIWILWSNYRNCKESIKQRVSIKQ